jgi:hypothetical protein
MRYSLPLPFYTLDVVNIEALETTSFDSMAHVELNGAAKRLIAR